MPAPPPTCELVLPPTADEQAIAEFLGARFHVAEDGASAARSTVYDTADRRLREAGLQLDLVRARGSTELVLHEPGVPDLAAAAPSSARYLAADLPGALCARLRHLIEVRALLAVVRMHTRSRALRVLDDEGKTVVRVHLERAEVTRRGVPALVLAPRLQLAGVLGYPKPLARVRGALMADLGLHEAEAGMLDEAAAALGIDPAGIQTRIDVDLAPGDRADHAAAAVCTALADVALANVPGTLEDLDSEFLHDLRVSVRRTRSVLRELRGVFGPEDLEHFRAELKWVQAATGPVRDLDVQLEEWPELMAELDPARQADLEGLHRLLERRRAAALRRLRADLRGPRFEALWSDWSELLASDLGPEERRPDAARPISAVAGRRIRRVYARMVKMGDAIDEDSPSGDLHDLRKRGKELRYLLEFFGGLWPEDVVKPMVKALKGLQDVLGRHEDRHAQIEQLRKLAPQMSRGKGGAQAVLALGMLTERLERDQIAARGEFADRFAAFAAADRRKLVDRTFRSRS